MVKFVFRWAFRLLVLAVVLAGVLILCKDALLKSWLEEQIRSKTGMDVKIRRLDVGIFSPTISVEGFKLYHPARFGGLPLVDAPDLFFEYDRGAWWRRQVHLRLARLNIAELNLVEDADSPDPIEWLQSVSLPSPSGAPHEEGLAGIDLLNLSLTTLKLTRWGDPPRVRTARVNLQKRKSSGTSGPSTIWLCWS